MWESERVRERERDSVCVRDSERVREREMVCERERERKREKEWERNRLCVWKGHTTKNGNNDTKLISFIHHDLDRISV